MVPDKDLQILTGIHTIHQDGSGYAGASDRWSPERNPRIDHNGLLLFRPCRTKGVGPERERLIVSVDALQVGQQHLLHGELAGPGESHQFTEPVEEGVLARRPKFVTQEKPVGAKGLFVCGRPQVGKQGF